MRALGPIIGIILAAPLLAEEVYRRVDDNGQGDYSGRPSEGAENIALLKAQTCLAPAIATRLTQPNAGGVV